MWLAHLLLFAGGSGLTAWIGTIVVVQNVVSSLFNSHLFDFTSGWLYVFGVGVVGGMVLRQRDCASTKSRQAAPGVVSRLPAGGDELAGVHPQIAAQALP